MSYDPFDVFYTWGKKGVEKLRDRPDYKMKTHKGSPAAERLHIPISEEAERVGLAAYEGYQEANLNDNGTRGLGYAPGNESQQAQILALGLKPQSGKDDGGFVYRNRAAVFGLIGEAAWSEHFYGTPLVRVNEQNRSAASTSFPADFIWDIPEVLIDIKVTGKGFLYIGKHLMEHTDWLFIAFFLDSKKRELYEIDSAWGYEFSERGYQPKLFSNSHKNVMVDIDGRFALDLLDERLELL